MFLVSFYRFYFALIAGAATYFLLFPNLWLSIVIVIAVRTIWLLVERFVEKLAIDRSFEEHRTAFKELYGPYGIRLINKAESNPSVKRSLAEVFTPNLKKLRENVKTLETMDVLFNAGMRPDGDSWQLHDLKLKYGKHRLEQAGCSGGEKHKRNGKR
ncbi:MAG: hypothetical protein JXA71_12440 [Chitinispirillaceae bacterium]|nr:hypothetical protein [Chitinispirillaceae bacterium]